MTSPSRRRQTAKHWARFNVQAKRCRTLPCAACTWCRTVQRTPTEAHHEPPRSLGGRDRDTMPLCAEHHRLRHQHGAAAFWSDLQLDPSAVLDAIRLGSPTPGDPYDAVPY